jgi:hypothetical protein
MRESTYDLIKPVSVLNPHEEINGGVNKLNRARNVRFGGNLTYSGQK